MSTEVPLPSVDAENAVAAVRAWSESIGASGVATEIVNMVDEDGYKLYLRWSARTTGGPAFRIGADLDGRLRNRMVNGVGSSDCQCITIDKTATSLDLVLQMYRNDHTDNITGCTIYYANGNSLPSAQPIWRHR